MSGDPQVRFGGRRHRNQSMLPSPIITQSIGSHWVGCDAGGGGGLPTELSFALREILNRYTKYPQYYWYK
jgi:hypothetical protein